MICVVFFWTFRVLVGASVSVLVNKADYPETIEWIGSINQSGIQKGVASYPPSFFLCYISKTTTGKCIPMFTTDTDSIPGHCCSFCKQNAKRIPSSTSLQPSGLSLTQCWIYV